MITEKEFFDLYEQLCQCYNRPYVELQMRAYYRGFAHMEYKEVEAYFIDAVTKFRFMPTVTDILATDRKLFNEKAWDKLDISAGRICITLDTTEEEKKEVNQLPEVAQAFLKEFNLSLRDIAISPENFYYNKFFAFASNYTSKNNNQKQLGEGK